MKLTNTEKTWRVGDNCYGLELLNLTQRHEIHNLKTSGFILENVTPSGVALLTLHTSNGWTSVSIFPNGERHTIHG